MIPLPININWHLVKYAAIALLVAGLAYSLYNRGQKSVQVKWDLERAQTAQVIADLKAKSAEVTTKVVTEYVEKVKIVKEKGDTIVKLVPKYITTEDNAACTINRGAIRVLNSAANQDELPATPASTDGQPSGVNLDTVVTSVADNYGTCNEIRAQVMGLQAWIRAQQKINP